jgi:hypothetical protein
LGHGELVVYGDSSEGKEIVLAFELSVVTANIHYKYYYEIEDYMKG